MMTVYCMLRATGSLGVDRWDGICMYHLPRNMGTPIEGDINNLGSFGFDTSSPGYTRTALIK